MFYFKTSQHPKLLMVRKLSTSPFNSPWSRLAPFLKPFLIYLPCTAFSVDAYCSWHFQKSPHIVFNFSCTCALFCGNQQTTPVLLLSVSGEVLWTFALKKSSKSLQAEPLLVLANQHAALSAQSQEVESDSPSISNLNKPSWQVAVVIHIALGRWLFLKWYCTSLLCTQLRTWEY